MGNTQEKPKSKYTLFQNDKVDNTDQFSKLKSDIKKGCKCTLKTRIIGFCICSAIGWTLEILAILSYVFGGDITRFAVIYTLGQVINIAAIFFLAGPIRQLKSMTDKKRLLLSIIWILSIIGTISFAVFVPGMAILTILCLIVQVVSYFLYSLSYIPYGQKMLTSLCKCCIQ